MKSKVSRFRYKIGESKNPQKRVKTVTEPSVLIFALPLLFHRYFERYLHRKYAHLRRPIKGNGGTEWFYFWVPFRPILWVAAMFTAQVVAVYITLNLLL